MERFVKSCIIAYAYVTWQNLLDSNILLILKYILEIILITTTTKKFWFLNKQI